MFGSRYDDVELLGRAVSRRPGWYPQRAGPAHAERRPVRRRLRQHRPGAAATAGAARARRRPDRAPGALAAGRVTDRFHPARGELPALGGNRRAFAQATWRHLLFGFVLGELERRLNAEPEPAPPAARARLRQQRPRLARARRLRRVVGLGLPSALVRVLITGASGFAGSFLARGCARAGDDVVGISLTGELADGRGEGVAVDLLDGDAVRAAVSRGPPRGRLPPGGAELGRPLVGGARADGAGQRRDVGQHARGAAARGAGRARRCGSAPARSTACPRRCR